jgi:hypothetical protein
MCPGEARRARRPAPRFVPQTPVSAWVQGPEHHEAYGVVANLSTSGACVVSNDAFDPGDAIQIMISFYHCTEMLEAEAQVVWTREDPRSEVPTFTYGCAFQRLSRDQRTRLENMLQRPSFQKAPESAPE